MNATVNYQPSDYLAMARAIFDNRPDEPTTFEAAYKSGGYTLYIEALYEYDCRTVRGGSYEGYDFERLSEITGESFDVISYECLDADGEAVDTDFTTSKLFDILNQP